MIIDIHTHVFPESIAEKALYKLAMVSCINPSTKGTQAALIESMQKNHVDYSVTLPTVTNPEKLVKINDQVIENLSTDFENGIIGFGGMHPDYNDISGECKRLKNAGVKGIKIHPAYQKRDFDDPYMMKLMDAASNEGLVILTHAGIDIGLYEHNYCSVKQILHVMDTVHPQKLILAHMGNWALWEEVEKDLAGAEVYLDTAFSIGKIKAFPGATPTPNHEAFLSDQDFVRLCKKHGINKILFGTDSPWQDQGYFIDLISNMDFTSEEKDKIFYQNASKLLEL